MKLSCSVWKNHFLPKVRWSFYKYEDSKTGISVIYKMTFLTMTRPSAHPSQLTVTLERLVSSKWPTGAELFKGFINFYFEVNIKYLFFFEPWLKFRICKILSNFWKLCVIYLIWHFWLLTTLTTLMDFSSLKIWNMETSTNREFLKVKQWHIAQIKT